MKPSIYYYNETKNGFELYFGECSTEEGLRLFDDQSEVTITSFGTTNYKDYGWATEKELPEFRKINDVISFLMKEGDIGIIDFEAMISGSGTISSHDDGEFHYVANSKRNCVAILKKAISGQRQNMLISTLVNNPRLYVTCAESGEVKKYSSFEEYVAKNA